MPVSWDELSALKSGAAWTIRTAREHLSFQTTDPWSGYWKAKQTLSGPMRALGFNPAGLSFDAPRLRPSQPCPLRAVFRNKVAQLAPRLERGVVVVGRGLASPARFDDEALALWGACLICVRASGRVCLRELWRVVGRFRHPCRAAAC